jgi:hypothetical protein
MSTLTMAGSKWLPVEEVRYDLDRVGPWRNMTAVTGGLTYRFLKLLNAWFVEIQRVTQGPH